MANTRPTFEAVFRNVIVPKIMEEVNTTGISKNACDWLQHSILHNTIGGKYNRGMTVPDTYRILKGVDALTEEEYKLSSILGWCTELLQAKFLVADDIMDSSITRRGHPCWYRVNGVGMIAINDSFLLGSAIFLVLKKFFRQESYYVDILELFNETSLQTELGQLLDLITAPEDKVDLNNFNFDKYYFIVRYKTAFYSFYLPVALALYQAGIATPKNLQQAKDVLIPLGEYFQVQDDYLDCYGDPEHIGKIGTDIQDNKCGWLVNKALELVTPEQRALLDANYGRKDAEAEKKVKQLYLELDVERHYKEYEAKAIKEIEALIDKVDESQGLKKAVLTGFLKKIAGRSK
ncbi:putative farnesyl-diphosphate synthetase [Sphaerosporella brunnea]|uniref:Putative farnesyl-diphosphate synthetase n=1 Tax=Sphaerosporella brunnea TaxID=1250544 RepID=A0A5J5F2R7_9PEZI|nr:putative farnesyl-diphosphate synthetase [Sphaerosporella brunnea]